MNKTANYQLNQWAKSDRVLMEDFNADNAKLDAALAALDEENTQRKSAISALQTKSSLQEIKTVSATTAEPSVTVPVNDISWSRWKIVAMEFRTNTDSPVVVYLNDSSSTVICGGRKRFMSLLFPMGRNDTLFAGLDLGASAEAFSSSYTFAEAESIRLKLPTGGAWFSVTFLGIA